MIHGQIPKTDSRTWNLLFAAWLIALVASLGALFVGEVMGQAPCDLCWHQRAFMFPLAIVLAVACLRHDASVYLYALPIAGFGWLVAAYHVLHYVGLVSEKITPCRQGSPCSGITMTILGGIPLPMLSLGAFTGILILVALVRRRPLA